MASSNGRQEIYLPPSSPPSKRQKNYHNSTASLAYNSDADDGDELFEGYVPDTPAALNGAYQTQPTQIIDRSAHNFSTASSSPGTPSKNEVQVPASSPLSGNGTKSSKAKSSKPTYNMIIGPPPRPGQNGAVQKRPLSSLMAPAGTTYKPPHGVVRNPVINVPDEEEVVDDDDEDLVHRSSGARKLPSSSSPTGGWKRSFVPGLPSFTPNPAATKAATSNITSQKDRPSTGRKPSVKAFNLIDHGHDIQVIDSSSEDELNALADIRPSTFKSKTANNSFDSSPPSQSGNGNTKFHNIVSNATYNGPERGMPSSGSAFANQGMPFNATFSSMSGGSRPFSSDSMSLGYGSARKPMQKKPERAAPVGEDLKIENLTDVGLRQKVTTLRQAFPGTSVLLCRNSLIQSKGNLDDAAHYLAGGPTRRLSSDEVESPHRPVAPIFAPQKKLEAPQMKRTLDIPVISLIDKYSSTQAPAVPRSTLLEIPKAKARKLVQGRRNRSSPAVPEVSSPPVIDEFDSDSGVASTTPEVDPALEDRLLKFLNTCTVEELVDLASTTTGYATLMIEARPFQSLDDADTVEDLKKTKSGKRSNRKPIGETIVQTCVTMFTGYEAIDTLVKKCDELGKPLLEEMSTWGFNTFGAAKGGEIEITSFGEQIASQRDSGIASPASANADTDADVDDDVKVISSTRKKGAVNFIKQPVMMPTKDADGKPLLLKDYQVVGLNWLAMMYRHGLSGILADEMGLGKTLQVIALLAHLAETGRSGPHLVICPGSTLENWLREIRRFAPGLTTEPYHGPKQQRVEAAERILERRNEVNIVVSTYDMAKNPDDNKFMRRLQPDVCIYDEGHYLKNPLTVRYEQLMKIPAGFKLLLTGTPLQNNLQELASLLSFILPEVFEEVVEDLHYIFKAKATTRDTDHAALLSAQRIARARSMLTPFILRRKKHQVLKHLPPKTLRVEHCKLHPDQAKIYNGHVDQARERARISKEGGKALKSENDENNPLMQLRKAAIHHLLFRRYFTNEKIEKMADILRAKVVKEFRSDKNHQRHHLISEMRGLSDFTLHYWCGLYPCIASFDIPGLPWMGSGKVEAMIKLVKKYKKNGDRVLIFSQFQLALDILEAVLNTSGIFYTRIDGSTKIEERQSLIDTFTKDTSITAFLLTTKAGGTGLNLMAANKVIIFDGSFNPHDDKQAEDRAHRVGQEREVEVVRLVTRDTIEEQIYALGVSKLTLDGRVSGDDEAAAKAAQEKGEKEVMRMFVEGVTASDDGTKPTIEGARWVDGDEDEKKKEAKPAAADDTKKDEPLPSRKRKSSILDTITRKSSRQKESKIIEVDEESDEMLV